MTESLDVASLVRPDSVHRRLYTDPAIFDLEMQRIFERAWIFVGHDSQVPEAGDYYHTTIGRQSVIMVRGTDGQVRVLYNRCPHKGAQLVGDTSGNSRHFRCLYHGWVFDTEGRNKVIPLEKGYDGSPIGKGKPCADMDAVARVGNYRGFVFASLAKDGPALEDWLGGVASSIDNMVDRSPEGALEVTGGVFRYLHDSNWKFFVENLNDMMHPMVAHNSSSLTARRVADKALGKDAKMPSAIEILSPFTNSYSFFDEMGLHAYPYGHGYSGGQVSIHSAYSGIPAYDALMTEAYGEERMKEIYSVNRHNTVVYPSLTLKGAIQTIRVVRPISVDKTLVESWVLRLKGAPEELLQRSILYCNLINSSFNLVGPDDAEAYRRQQLGLMTEANDWVSMHRYMGQETPTDHGGQTAIGSSDLAFRNQYAAWAQYMSAED